MAVRRLPTPAPVWAFTAMFAGIPVWWFLGLSGFIWPVLAAPMLAWLLLQPRVRHPAGMPVLLLFFAFVVASGVALTTAARLEAFVYRALLYASIAVLLVFLYNVPRTRLPLVRAVRVLAFVWVVAVVGGYLGLLFPHHSFASITERLLPGSVVHNPLVFTFVHPGFAETTSLLGYPVPRPKAPFNYTNQWGANTALLTPFFIAWLTTVRAYLVRVLGSLLLAVSLVPIIVSLNRGLWLSLGAGIVYVAVRLALRGRVRALAAVISLIAVLAVLLLATPLGTVVSDRFANPNTQARSSLYQDALNVVQGSPVIGFGAPLPSEETPGGPNVGTHGQLWTLMVSQGVLGLLVYLAWLGRVLVRTGRGEREQLWLHSVIVISAVQLPYYAALPAQLHFVAVAIALVLREQDAEHAHERPAAPLVSSEPAYEVGPSRRRALASAGWR